MRFTSICTGALLVSAQSLAAQSITSLNACRVDSTGTVVVFGKTSLRDGTMLTMSAFSRQMPAEVNKGGFGSAHFIDTGDLSSPQAEDVRIISDPASGNRHLDATRNVTLAPYAPWRTRQPC